MTMSTTGSRFDPRPTARICRLQKITESITSESPEENDHPRSDSSASPRVDSPTAAATRRLGRRR
jgi:hypothetical protein